jgi:raffinose/stachyose/melibiose transport system substrate-binding protein
MSQAFSLVRRHLALLVVALAYVWSAVGVYMLRSTEIAPELTTLRIAHWQLETGVRDALQEMAAEYQKRHPNVRIIQEAIPETAYGQWVTTQLIGGTAPDMIQIGAGLPPHIWIAYQNRYCIPISGILDKPNPYNEGTDLEGVPFRETMKDGMRRSYVSELQEYYSFPLCQAGVRIFYNKDLLRKLTGRDEVPTEYREFLKVCEEIAQHTDAGGKPYVPIACSRYHFHHWDSFMFRPVTHAALSDVDLNRNGLSDKEEFFVAIKTGRLDFHHPAFLAFFTMVREVSRYFQAGYTGLGRDEAVFQFAQQRAVFITTTSFDYLSLVEQAEGLFEIGVMDFPVPAPDDPYYGGIVEGHNYESVIPGFSFGITHTSKHPEEVLDFMLFMAGQKQNERFCRIVGWIPSVVGAESSPILKIFEPHLEGAYDVLRLELYGETWIKWLQLYSLYQVQQISCEELLEQFEPFYKEQGMRDFNECLDDWTRVMLKDERLLAVMRIEAMAADGQQSQAGWLKYLKIIRDRMVRKNVARNRLLSILNDNDSRESLGSYEYRPEALRNVRDRLRSKMKK